MLRIISGLVLLIISQMSFASVSTSSSVIAAASSQVLSFYNTNFIQSSNAVAGEVAACAALGSAWGGITSGVAHPYLSYVYINATDITCTFDYIYNGASYGHSAQTMYGIYVTKYSCSSGVLSDSSGNASSSGHYCNTTVSTDSCASYAGQKTYLWVSKTNPQTSVCDGTCVATSTVAVGFPDALPNSYQGAYYTYTGQTGSCTDVNTGWVDETTAANANAAAVKADADAKLKAAEDACGSQGYIIDKLVTGPQSVICNSAFANLPSGALPTYNPTTPTTVTNSTSGATSSATSTNPDGTTTTTKTSTTSTSDTSSTGGAGGSGGSTTTITTTTVKNPDGTTKSTSDTSTGSGNFPGMGADYKYADSKRNDWGSRNFSTVISDNVTKLKDTNLYGSVTGFFTVSFSGSAAPSNFNTSYKGANLSASFDWAANLAPFQSYIRAIVMFVCSYVAFRRCIE